MNQFLPDTLFNGILLCVSIQLVLLGLFHIVWTKKISLGFICYIIGSVWLYDLYFPVLKNNIIANVLLSGYKELAIFPLFYLFFLSRFEEGNHRKRTLNHLFLPALIFLVYLSIKLGFSNFFKQHFGIIIPTIYFIGIVIFFGYSFATVRLFSRHKMAIKPNIFKRYIFIFAILFFQKLFGILDFSITPFLDIDKTQYYILSNRYFFHPLDFLIKCSLLVFAFLEIDFLKKLVFGSNISNQFISTSNKEQIELYIQNHLHGNKAYIDKDFNIKSALVKFGINEKDFRIFIKKEYNMTINNFINDLKLKEFIRVSNSDYFTKYNMDGLLEMSGFNSKATFYRLFKKHYNMTPSEYLKNKELLSN